MRRTLTMAGLGFLLSSGAFAQEIPAIQPMPPLRPIAPMQPMQAAPMNTVTITGTRDPSQVPRMMPTPVPLLSPEKPITHKEREGLRQSGKWRAQSPTPSLGTDGVVYFQYGQGEPVIVCAPLRVCDIALEPGERVTAPPFLADHRWTAEPGPSGPQNKQTTHIIVKPSDVGLTTNMIVQTDRRTYSFQLTSRAKDYMPMVAFDYPASKTQQSWATYLNQPPTTPPSAYQISGDDAPFRPVQVYAVSTPVGQKTCIEMPADIGSLNLPALLAIIEEGSWLSDPTRQMVNYRFANHRYVVDGLLTHFELVDGVGSNQQIVNINAQGIR
jgi:P-type conjugative transfer protein TrbG